MEHYVTLFDAFFLPQGLALYRSLQRLNESFTLWVLCMDEDVSKHLIELNLSHVRLLTLSELETPELLQVKQGRSRAEYCWTLTPFTPAFVFQADAMVPRVTYVDADLWFLRSPQEIFAEFDASGKSVLITEHAYHPPYDMSATSGKYCVQFMTFVRGTSEPVRKWWEDQCIAWCYDRFEAGRFGDQKYLDDWLDRFPESVHVLQNRGWARAPWNVLRFLEKDAIFYHFHGLRLGTLGIMRGSYPIPRSFLKTIYDPYAQDISWALQRMVALGLPAPIQAPITRYVRQSLGRLRRLILNRADLWCLFS